jgi:hypothetical protein
MQAVEEPIVDPSSGPAQQIDVQMRYPIFISLCVQSAGIFIIRDTILITPTPLEFPLSKEDIVSVKDMVSSMLQLDGNDALSLINIQPLRAYEEVVRLPVEGGDITNP